MHPLIRERRKQRIKVGAQVLYQRRQRIREVFVFANSEAMMFHDNTVTKLRLVWIKSNQRRAFLWRKHRRRLSVAIRPEGLLESLPVERCKPILDYHN